MSTTLKPGDKAPSFTATDQDGNKVSLEDYSGRRLILYFYPKDDTPGCTAEACNLRDNYDMLREKGFEVLGVSVDSGKSHKKFEQKYNLPFRLVADDEKKVVNDYGVFGEKKFMGKQYMGTHRTTFVINGEGIIEKIIDKPDTKNHARQVLDALEA